MPLQRERKSLCKTLNRMTYLAALLLLACTAGVQSASHEHGELLHLSNQRATALLSCFDWHHLPSFYPAEAAPCHCARPQPLSLVSGQAVADPALRRSYIVHMKATGLLCNMRSSSTDLTSPLPASWITMIAWLPLGPEDFKQAERA